MMSVRTKVFLALTVGSFLPVVGWLWGVQRVWQSAGWSRWDKWIAVLAFPGGPFAALLTSVWIASLTVVTCSSGVSGTLDPSTHNVLTSSAMTSTCTNPVLTPWIGGVIVVVVVLLSVAGPLWLLRGFRAAGAE
jgi:hypothetical protein